MRRETPPPPKDGIHRSIPLGIPWALVATAIGGVSIALGGDTVLHDPAVNRFGAVLALVGAGLYIVFRFLGAREAKRRQGPGA